ncbi:MAG: hypothetical protein ASARMPRED_009247 [Alectoria sarmentosa]|nr:MAG: hypothetical protein ASARMPRED_009247 [Alectoria sarmentosa]
MHIPSPHFLSLSVFVASVVANPIEHPSTVRAVPNIVRQNDWGNMVAFAWNEANQVTDTFKRWFDASNAQDVQNVLERMMAGFAGLPQPVPMMTQWVCEQDDVKGQCIPSRNAYSVSNKGQFHFCPPGLAQPNAPDLTCADLDAFPSAKMRSVATTMLHESTHWTEVGDAALGTHIKDFANSAYDCFNLSPASKLTNAQNYAFLGAEAYYKIKGCTFSDPTPAATDPEVAASDDLSVSPTTFASGWCGMHVTQYQKNEPGSCTTCNNPEYQLEVCVKDTNGVVLNQLPGESGCGTFVALNGVGQPLDTALPYLVYVTVGAVDSDAVLFSYGDQNWGSNDQAHHSDFGAYDSGSRQGDTGFSC